MIKLCLAQWKNRNRSLIIKPVPSTVEVSKNEQKQFALSLVEGPSINNQPKTVSTPAAHHSGVGWKPKTNS